jgi:hypothetical protein
LAGDQRRAEIEIESEAAGLLPILRPGGDALSAIGSVRRRLVEKDRRLREFEALQDHSQHHIDHLEAKTEKAVADFCALEREMAAAEQREKHAQEHIYELERRLKYAKRDVWWQKLRSRISPTAR